MKISRLLILASVAALAACQQGGSAAGKEEAKDPGKEPVATVDGTSLSRNTFDFYVKAATGKTSADLSAEERDQALDSLVRLQLIAAQADKDGVGKDKEIASALELSRMDVLQRAAQQKYLKD